MTARLALICTSQGGICVNVEASGERSRVIGFAWLVSELHCCSTHKGYLLAKLLGDMKTIPLLMSVLIHWKGLIELLGCRASTV